MKHTLSVTFIFISLFIIAQLVGLTLLNSQVNVSKDAEGKVSVQLDDTAFIERPNLSGFESIAYIFIGVFVGTFILLFLAKRKKVNLWKAWFFLAVFIALTIALGAMFDNYPLWISLVIAGLLTIWKVFFPNLFIQNITEILMYSGLALILAPMLNVLTGIIILIAFSFYDMYAVWKSKHMVTMAKFAYDAKLFPGFSLSYSKDDKKIKGAYHDESGKKRTNRRTGVLGGGDVVFPLLFAGTVLLELVGKGFSKQAAFGLVMFIVVSASVSLFYLFFIGKKDKFYPAMPFLTVGCLIGYGLMTLFIFIF